MSASELVGDLLQPALGVAHGRRVVAVDGTEVALPVDQRVAQREVLRHPDERVVDRHVAVRMVFPHHVADDARALHVRAVEDDVRLVHRVQDAAMDRLQPVADVRKRPADDHAHRVIEVGMPHFRFEAYRQGFFGKLLHVQVFFVKVALQGLRWCFGAPQGPRARRQVSKIDGTGTGERESPAGRGPGNDPGHRRVLKRRNFITTLHRRDTRLRRVAEMALSFAPHGGLCYSFCGNKGFGACMPSWA